MSTALAPDGRPRCSWCLATPQYLAYHDHEWGFPVIEDRRLFEKLCLEGFQAGLSWRTILEKRENFRHAFAGFDIDVLAGWDAPEVERLLQDAGIVRHRGKIESVLNNARRAQELVRDEGSLAAWIWRHEPAAAEQAAHQGVTTSPTSIQLSKALKKRGFSFVGPTTVHAFLQSMGLINDHAKDCAVRDQVDAARAALRRPG
ncbi:MAG: DNA-3-methyladenine glycosylase I [Proteobacteria bacterium]|nr:DNA-3-methyladenine glycosylase I [Pseudomonadota bacterium]